jgi:hypothetical protein
MAIQMEGTGRYWEHRGNSQKKHSVEKRVGCRGGDGKVREINEGLLYFISKYIVNIDKTDK